DRVRLRLVGSERGYSRAIDWSVEQAGPERRPPPCSYASRCGGCDLMALNPGAQRQAKHQLVVEVMRRTAHIDVSGDSPVSLTWHGPVGGDLGYRSRIRVHIDRDGQFGFLAHQSHEL